MRVSTAALHQQGLAGILRNQAALAKTQNQLALGSRLVTAKDDPGAWARASGVDQHLAQLGRYRDNASIAQHRLGLQENALVSVNDVLNRVRELALQANSAANAADGRRAIGDEIQARLNDLLALANSDDGQGRFLFAGTDDGSVPFSLTATGASYVGNSGVRLVDIGPERAIALGDAGDFVFQSLSTGNGTFAVAAATSNTGTAALGQAALADAASWDGGSYTLSFSAGNYEIRDAGNALVGSGAYQAGTNISFRGVSVTLSGAPADGDSFTVAPSQPQDVFATVQKLARIAGTLPADAAGRAQQQTEFYSALEELDGAMTHLNEVRGSIGHRLRAVDDVGAQIDALDVQANSTLSGIRDLDYAEAITRMNMQMTAMQAAQQSYSQIQGLSLFDFLR